jgi:hypothetical protein
MSVRFGQRSAAGLRTRRPPTRSSFPVQTEPVLSMELSFLLTAAGQFRIRTGFPFQSVRENQTP